MICTFSVSDHSCFLDMTKTWQTDFSITPNYSWCLGSLTSVTLFPDVLTCHAPCVNQMPIPSTQSCSYQRSAVVLPVHSPIRHVASNHNSLRCQSWMSCPFKSVFWPILHSVPFPAMHVLVLFLFLFFCNL